MRKYILLLPLFLFLALPARGASLEEAVGYPQLERASRAYLDEYLGLDRAEDGAAGAKAILDLGLTLEYLETKGVPVLGYQTEELPAFYTRRSGFKVDYRLDTPEEFAAVYAAKASLGLGGGILAVNPIPEEYSMDHDYINSVIDDACQKAAELGVKGKETTPFLLAAVKDITAGKSLEANIQLVYNNARLASKIAFALCAAENVVEA